MAIKNSFTLPEYTYDNFQAQMDWNREIKNNKQGYLAVDIMPMKDFYDAGGYAFVNDYKAELAAVDAAYDRALPSYGAQGEQMAKAGLQGSGYSDYLAGQAYATRAAGQAVARQNAMANSNSFRAAYNQYVAQQKEKREANLQSVIERAQSVNMNPDNFVEIAKKLGIPEEDAKRGKEALIAYYMGIGKVDSNGKPITGGTASGTTGNTNAVWGNVSTEEQNAAIKGVYQSILGGMTGLADSDGNVIMPQYSTIDAMVKSEYGSQYSTESPEVQEAIRQFAASRVSDIEGWVARGEINGAKQQLDQLAEYGVFGKDGQNSEQYQATLGKIQDAVASTIASAYQSGSLDSYAEALTRLGYNTDKLELNEDNADEVFAQAVDALYQNGSISQEAYETYYETGYQEYLEGVESRKTFEKFLVAIGAEKGKLGEKKYEKIMSQIKVNPISTGRGKYTQEMLEVTLPNGETFRYDIEPYAGDAKKKFLSQSTKGYQQGDYMSQNGELYVFAGKDNVWVKVQLVGVTDIAKKILLEELKKSS